MTADVEEARSAKARRVFIEAVLGVLHIEQTPDHEPICDAMLMRMARNGVIVMALPEEIARRLVMNDREGIAVGDTISTVEADHAADVQGDPVPQDG